MKLLTLVIAASVLFGTVTPSAQAREAVSLDFFYDTLEPHGSWREVGNYGYCWQPSHVDDGWRPYSDGRWVYTDAGWTWDSDEPYGWAVYHYGRWANVQRVGWVWIPGTEWGPGWVSWRRSPRYVGWAPLPPEALFLRAFGFSAWVDSHYDIGPSSYRFVDGRNFGARRMRSVFIDQRENLSIIHQTTNITNITYVNNVVHNGGLLYDEQSRVSSEPIQRYKLERRADSDGDPRRLAPEALRSNVVGESLSVFAPSVTESSKSAPKKFAAKVAAAEIDRGWADAGSASEVAAMRGRLHSKIVTPDKLPPQARFERTVERSPVAEERSAVDRAAMKAEQAARAKAKDEAPGGAGALPMAPGNRPRVEDSPPAGSARAKQGIPAVQPEQTPPSGKGKMRNPLSNDAPAAMPGPRAGKEMTKPAARDLPKQDRKPEDRELKPMPAVRKVPKAPEAGKSAPRSKDPVAAPLPPSEKRGKASRNEKEKADEKSR